MCTQKENKEWKYPKKTIAGRLFVNLQEFSQVDRSSGAEVAVAQRSKFIFYS